MKQITPYLNPSQALKESLIQHGVQGFLVFGPENRHYLSGFGCKDCQINESTGCLLISNHHQALLTDPRFALEAKEQTHGFDIHIYRGDPSQLIKDLIAAHPMAAVGVEEEYLTHFAFRRLQETLGEVKLTPMHGLIESFRVIKDEVETRLMAKSLRITEDALIQTVEWLRPGIQEMEAAQFFLETATKLGADGPSFAPIVASGPNAAHPHADPTRKAIKLHETIIFDVGVKYKGYASDITRTIILGQPKPWAARAYNLVKTAQDLALKELRPGLKSNEVDALVRGYFKSQGVGELFHHSTGHGIGLATHEPPSLSQRMAVELRPGMILAVEPGLYFRHRGGVRLERMVRITEDGCKVMGRPILYYNFD